VDSLKKIKDPSCIPALRKALEKDSYSTVRSDAAAALVAFEDRDALPLFIKGLKDGWSNVRLACVRALAKFGSKEAIKPLVERLSDKKDSVREQAAIALGEMAGASVLPALAKTAGDEYETVRESVYNAITEIGRRHRSAAKQAADILAEKGLSDKIFNPKMSAVRGLLQLKDSRGTDALLEALKEKYEFRITSAIQLGVEEKVKDPRFLKALEDLVKSDKTPPIVKEKAAEARKELEAAK
jgi:HEAT repeat protein